MSNQQFYFSYEIDYLSNIPSEVYEKILNDIDTIEIAGLIRSFPKKSIRYQETLYWLSKRMYLTLFLDNTNRFANFHSVLQHGTGIENLILVSKMPEYKLECQLILANIRDCNNLSSLSFENFVMEGATPIQINLQNLKTLNLRNCTNFADFQINTPNLNTLKIAHSPVPQSRLQLELEIFPILIQATNITELDLCEVYLSAGTYEILQYMKLKKFKAVQCYFPFENCHRFARFLENNANMELLHLAWYENYKINTTIIEYVGNAINTGDLPVLKSLTINLPMDTIQDRSHILPIQKLRHLKYANFLIPPNFDLGNFYFILLLLNNIDITITNISYNGFDKSNEMFANRIENQNKLKEKLSNITNANVTFNPPLVDEIDQYGYILNTDFDLSNIFI